ncbi:MAG: glycosyltransferase [Microbacteriaceae bacterium]|nr:glycosyltransferase [Microbacteriaceae bacterium]
MAADTFGPDINGAAIFTERLAAGLILRGHEVHIVAPSPDRGKGVRRETFAGVEMTVHRLKSYRWYPHEWLRFTWPWTIRSKSRRILDLVKPDVVHFQSHIIIGRGMAIEAQKRGIRIIGTNHTMPENLIEHTMLPKFIQPWFIKMAWNAAAKTFARASAITTPTLKAAEYFEKALGITGVYPISCGLDISGYKPDWSDKDPRTLLFVGRLNAEKRIDVLIKAFAEVAQKHNVKLKIVGEGDQRKHLTELTKKLGVQERVEFTGYREDADIIKDYSEAFAFVMPSTAELQSIATMEAMASALPVIAANAMALPHLVHDDQNGYLFAPDNVEDLTEKMNKLIELPDKKLRDLREESLKIVKGHDIKTTLDTFEKLYRGEVPETK